jgi:hypothetical protein
MVILKYAQTNIVTTISPIVSKQRAFCWLKTGLGLMSLGGICSADSAHCYRFPCLVSRYTNAGEAWAFTIGRGMAELVGLLVWPSAWDIDVADRNLALGPTNQRVEYPTERSLSTNNGTANCGPINGKSDQTGIYAAWMDVSL